MDRGFVVRLLLFLLMEGVKGLKNLKITVPERVRAGDSALLTCSYDLDGASLYTIKWYLDDEEFYRYVPNQNPSFVTFPVKGIEVKTSGSNAQEVMLVKLRGNHTGQYKCEVSEDHPNFETYYLQANLVVADVPETEPVITSKKQHLDASENLEVNCTSGASRPAANITWMVNNEILSNKTMIFQLHQRRYVRSNNKEVTRSSLTLSKKNAFLRRNKLRLRCFAEISPVYKASAELQLFEYRPYLAPITGDVSQHSLYSSASSVMAMLHWSLAALSLVLNLVWANR